MLKDYLKLSIDSILHKGIRSWLTMIGIFIGIAAVVSLVSLGGGLENAILDQFSSLGTDKLTVQASGGSFGPPGTGVIKPLTVDDADALENVRGVDMVAPRAIATSRAIFKDESAFLTIATITTDETRQLVLAVLDAEVDQGRMLEKDERYKITIGSDFGTEDIFSKPVKVGDTINMRGQDFEVVGILAETGAIFGNSLVIMNDKVYEEVFDTKDINIIAIQIQKGADIEQVSANVEKAMRKQRDVKMGEKDFTVETPLQAAQTVTDILDYVTYFIAGIAAVSLIVGGIGIANTMFTAVLERRKEIGIMKAIGARNSHILLLFLIESALLGLAGGTVGLFMGMGFAKLVELIASIAFTRDLIKVSFDLIIIVGPLMFSIIVGMISGVFPALQAAKLNPVDALRK